MIVDCQNFIEIIPPCCQDQNYANSREATRTLGNRFHMLPAQIIFSNRTHLLPNYIVHYPYISCILDHNLHLRIAWLMMPLLGNATKNKKIRYSEHAQNQFPPEPRQPFGSTKLFRWEGERSQTSQWHVYVSKDEVWAAPHLLFLGKLRGSVPPQITKNSHALGHKWWAIRA